MRSILIIALIVVYVIATLPAILVFHIISKKNPKKAERGAHACMSWLLRSIAFIAGTKLVIKGFENVPTDKPVLYVSNHSSYFDIIFTYPRCALPTAYVAKSDLQHIPFFSIWGRLMRCLFFDRNDAKSSIKMIMDCTEDLKTDTSVYIFPEGMRNKTPGGLPLNKFHDGSFKPAQRSGAPIIPIAIKDAASVWEAHMPWVKKKTIYITYGDPIYYKDLAPEDRKHIGGYVQKIVEDMLTADPQD